MREVRMFENISTLDDLLGLAIGFVTIMLILSLVVTALLQVLQNILRLRFNNLAYGIMGVLKATRNDKNITLQDIKDKILAPPMKELGKKVLILPKKTWIEPDELIEKISETLNIQFIKAEKEEIIKKFKDSYTYMNKRFQAMLRYWSFVLALLVAFYFQVDSFDVIKRLSSDAELRASVVETARKMVNENEQDSLKYMSNEEELDSALVLLKSEFPSLAAKIEPDAKVGADRDEAVNKLNAILADDSQETRDSVVEKYDDLLDNLYREQISVGIERYEKYNSELALIDIQPFANGRDFYKNPKHLLGMLITAIFLSFGAPFWFERLRELIKLKDSMQPETKKDEGKEKK